MNNFKQFGDIGKEQYEEASKIILFLSEIKIKLIGNDMRKVLGRKVQEVDKESVLSGAKRLNEIATENELDFRIPEDWEALEKFLRLTIMEDLETEFARQGN